MAGRLEFDVTFGRPGRRRDDGEPMRLLVMADFSRKAPTERTPLADRVPCRVDVDTFDQIIRRVAPRLNGTADDIAFTNIDDFHPDRLYARLDRFRFLREARTNPPAEQEDLLRRLLGGTTAPETLPQPAPSSGVDALIRTIVAPHIVKDTLAQSQQYLAAVDGAIAGDMRALLHDPGFQTLESTWRGVHWLVSNLELDEQLQLHLFDVTREELIADVAAAGQRLSDTGLHRALVERSRDAFGGQRWSVLVGLMQFGLADADMGLLAALGLIASRAGGPVLAGADPALSGGGNAGTAAWQALRHSEAAKWIGLVVPRVLLRLPYGQRSDPIDSFAFEEFVGPPEHEHFLWGNGALATTLLIGRAFNARGWDMEPGDEREIADLPAFTFERDGEREMQACAERYMTESEVHALLKAGLIPLASRRDRNALIAVRFQSVSDPPAALAW